MNKFDRQGRLINIIYLNMENIRRQLIKLADDYFAFMARAYPVMTLSDEFYFFPRASQAIQYLNCLDSLDKEKTNQNNSQIKTLMRDLERLDTKKMDLETQIDYQLIKASMNGFLREFQNIKIWQNDPNLYLKIIILGIEQIVHKLPMIKRAIRGELTSRIKQIPRLLKEAKTNLKQIPLYSQEVAIQTAEATVKYLKTDFLLFLKARGLKTKELKLLTSRAIQSLEEFKRFLKRKTSSEDFIKDRAILEDLLINGFSYQRSLREIFEIASWEYQRIRQELKMASSHIQPAMSWQGILSNYRIKIKNKKELLSLYSHQIICLRDFLAKSDLINLPRMQNIKVRQTPVYLAPIRASASYSCPLSKNQKESAFFYVSINNIKENIHQEYIFVTAHETYPGHHLLDSIRRNIQNPIRRQIESPLFYEGWASYAERLIDEFGYQKHSRQRLVGLRRQAWRAIRAKLDVGIRINKIKPSQAADELRWLGYSSERVKAMLRHYILTYGYQLCYTIGKFEIENLRKKFVPLMGIKNFHSCLLGGGQLPFDSIKKRMERLCKMNS